MAITIDIAEGKTIARATAEGKILAKVLGQYNVKNFERSYLLNG